MLVPECILLSLLFADSCGKNRHALHAATTTPTRLVHGAMQGMWKEFPHHTASDKEKQCKPKTALPPNAVLWLPQNHPTHIKREKRIALQIRGGVYCESNKTKIKKMKIYWFSTG
jgi:hypothetical protein